MDVTDLFLLLRQKLWHAFSGRKVHSLNWSLVIAVPSVDAFAVA
jgi:hypothetical protein